VKRLKCVGGQVTLNTEGKVLVLPTGNSAILPRFNEYTLDPNRLTIAESPFGGLKGSGSPDFAPGTIFCQTDGVYLTDTSGTNSTKTLTAGKLKEMNLLTVDTVAHSITEEFIVRNDSLSNNPNTVNACNSLYGVESWDGSTTRTLENGGIRAVGTTASDGSLSIYIPCTLRSNDKFVLVKLISPSNCTAKIILSNSATSQYTQYGESRFPLVANTERTFVLPILAPAETVGQNPNIKVGNLTGSTIALIVVGIGGLSASSAAEFTVRSVVSDVAKPCYVEMQVPDYLADTSAQIYTHNGSAYQLCQTCKLDSTYSDVSTTDANCTLYDGTKLSDVYGTGNGRSVFPKGISGEVKTGSLANSSITYSANKGTKYRVGFRVDLPPSDGGRTLFNKIRLKTIIYYDDEKGSQSVLKDLSGNNHNGNLTGGVTALENGGLKFDGINGTVTCDKYTGLTTAGKGAVLIDFTPLRTQVGDFFSFNFVDNSDGSGLRIQFNTDAIAAFFYNTSTGYETGIGMSPISLNTRHVLVLTWENGVAKLFLDNNLVDSRTLSREYTLKGTMYLGSGFSGAAYYNCVIYNVEVYDNISTTPSLNFISSPITKFKPVINHMGSTTYEFSNDPSASTGLQNMVKPWLAVLDAPRTDILPDSSGNGNHGVMSNVAMAYDAQGNPYGAMSFNGSSSYVDCGSNSSLTTQGARTVSFFMKSTQLSGNKEPICFRDDTGLIFVGNQPLLLLNDGNYSYFTGSDSYFDGTWKHIIFTLAGVGQNDIDNSTLMINGNSINHGTITKTNSPLTWGTHTIGKGGYGYFNGLIKDVKIWNRILTSDEKTALANGQYVSPTGLVASWKPYQPSSDIDFFLSTYRPKALSYKRDESGSIYEVTLYPGNGLLYHGRITYPNLLLDSDSNLIPNCLEASVEGSLTKFLQSYGMII
jgi:hypothetical protein